MLPPHTLWSKPREPPVRLLPSSASARRLLQGNCVLSGLEQEHIVPRSFIPKPHSSIFCIEESPGNLAVGPTHLL